MFSCPSVWLNYTDKKRFLHYQFLGYFIWIRRPYFYDLSSNLGQASQASSFKTGGSVALLSSYIKINLFIRDYQSTTVSHYSTKHHWPYVCRSVLPIRWPCNRTRSRLSLDRPQLSWSILVVLPEVPRISSIPRSSNRSVLARRLSCPR